jgi:subtilisin family serine protease
MRINELPPDFRGRGVRIAVIDSGAATSHASLRHISQGIDLLGSADETGRWNVDPLGHGTHAAGIIGAADPSFGVRGIAPEAELHVCKLLPGGQISQLIEALEYCIAHQIDVVNLGVGVAEPCEALEQQIARAKRFGVACVAAAGNSGDAVQYPASSPNVLAVAAIGKAGEFPPDSYHGETMNGDADAEGYFSARFSCYGPRVDVCAPGVAIVSTVPPNDFAAWDGTSAAAPHVTGLAALLLAHHPLFQGAGRVPNADRVDRLFQMIRMECCDRRTGRLRPDDGHHEPGVRAARAAGRTGAGRWHRRPHRHAVWYQRRALVAQRKGWRRLFAANPRHRGLSPAACRLGVRVRAPVRPSAVRRVRLRSPGSIARKTERKKKNRSTYPRMRVGLLRL